MTDNDNHPDRSRPEKRSWIFQAVPDQFDLIDALKHVRIFRWRVNQFKDEIRAGDDVFLWLSGRGGGIVGRGTVLTNPQIMKDAHEERPFVKAAEDEGERLRTAIEIDTVFSHAVQREALQSHPVLSSISLLQQARGTNFALTENQADALNALCPQATRRAVSLAEAFSRFHVDPIEQIRVSLRRKRAEQLRAFLRRTDGIDLDAFNREVWQFESATILNGRDIRGTIFASEPSDRGLSQQVADALAAATLELHGNYVWRSGSTVYGSMLTKATVEEKEGHIRTALGILNSETLTPTEMAQQLKTVPGFGFTNATGLLMVFHPDEFALWDAPSKGAFSKLHLPYKTLTQFQENAANLKSRLGADDFLELDWFLYQINRGVIEIADHGLHEKMLRDIDDQVQANIGIASEASETEKEQLVKSRIGQGLFRQNVQRLESACRVSGVADPRFLIASHIKPWRACDNHERLDGANGLFLSPNIDLLFDRGHISFDDDGTLLVAPGLDPATLHSLGVPSEKIKCGEFSPKQKKYLAFHRQQLFLG